MKINKKGSTYLFLVGAIAVIIMITMTLLSTATTDYRGAIFLKRSFQCYNLAEGGITQAISFMKSGGDISKSQSKNFKLGDGGFSLTIENKKDIVIINSTGFIPFDRPQLQRTIKAYIVKDGEAYKVKDKEYL